MATAKRTSPRSFVAAEMAARFDAYIQTHLAENREELEKVHHLYMSARDYTHVYEKCGLLTSRTVLGHCIHLNPREIAAIADAQSTIAHCPSSNLFLGSGLIKLDQLLKAGIPVGLGSDVAGGPELNMWQVMRAAIDVQKARTAYEPNLRPHRYVLETRGPGRHRPIQRQGCRVISAVARPWPRTPHRNRPEAPAAKYLFPP